MPHTKRLQQNSDAASQLRNGNHHTDLRRVPLMQEKPRLSVSAPRCYSRRLRSARWQPDGKRLMSLDDDGQSCPLTIFGYGDVSTGSSGTTCSREQGVLT